MSRFAPHRRRPLAGAFALTATLLLGGCSLPGAPGSWRSEARCQPPGGGWGPEHVLPDPAACPEAYEGNDDGGWAPEVPEVDPGPSEPWQPAPTPPCSGTGSLNGFPCSDVDPRGNPGPFYP